LLAGWSAGTADYPMRPSSPGVGVLAAPERNEVPGAGDVLHGRRRGSVPRSAVGLFNPGGGLRGRDDPRAELQQDMRLVPGSGLVESKLFQAVSSASCSCRGVKERGALGTQQIRLHHLLPTANMI